jgi:hypothetical protein
MPENSMNPNPEQPMDLPPDGSSVTAMTYESISNDTMPQMVTGELTTRESPFGPPPQCWIGNIQVDPATVKLVSDD